MADMGARRGAAPAAAWPAARARALSSLVLLLGLVTAGGMAAALLGSGAGEIAILGLLALLAVAGAFLIFGLLSGYLRVSERVAEAEIVKTVADGLETALKIVDGQGTVLYRNRALQRLTGRRAGRHATLEELFAGEPDSAQAFFRLNRAAERGEPREEEFYVRSRIAEARAGRWLRVAVRPFPAPAPCRRPFDALASHGRDARAHPRDRGGQRARVDARLLRQPAARALRRHAGGAPGPYQRHAVAMAAPAAGVRDAR